jgi:hypothetical protein
VRHEGAPKYHLEAAEINVRVVSVAPDVLRSASLKAWDHVCQSVSPTKKGGFGDDATPLFEACLLVSHESAAGCLLVAGFQHVLGDASSYSMFLRCWSDIYEVRLHGVLQQIKQKGDAQDAFAAAAAAAAAAKHAQAAAAEAVAQAERILSDTRKETNGESSSFESDEEQAVRERGRFIQLHAHILPAPELPQGVFQSDTNQDFIELQACAEREDSGEKEYGRRRFFFLSSQYLASLKGRHPVDKDGCTSNDLLMAQFACAIAPFRLAALRAEAGIPPSGSGPSSGWGTDPINTPARIVVLADHRGRGIDPRTWGNHSVDLSVVVSFNLLLSGDVAAVARGMCKRVECVLCRIYIHTYVHIHIYIYIICMYICMHASKYYKATRLALRHELSVTITHTLSLTHTHIHL